MSQQLDADLNADLLARAKQAALAVGGQQRARELLAIAGLLRKSKRHKEALQLLDDLVDRFEYRDVVRAAYTCAIAIHSDLGNPDLAVRLAEEQRSRDEDRELLNAMVRALWERFEATGEEEHREEWLRCSSELESLV